jgi:hypothetical protein
VKTGEDLFGICLQCSGGVGVKVTKTAGKMKKLLRLGQGCARDVEKM